MESNPVVLFLVSLWWLIPVAALLVSYKQVLRVFGIVIIPKDTLGEVNKKFVIFGSHRTLPEGKIIALEGEAGVQADTLAPGVHYFLWPWQYDIKREPFTTIGRGHIGCVESRDGTPISGGRVLGKEIPCGSFQNAREFLTKGGERGSQIAVIPPGAYRINRALFAVTEVPVKDIEDNMVGIVTTKEGAPLDSKKDIAGKEIAGHNMYQNGQIFLTNGGFKGLQEQVMLAGRYFLNPLFATVEMEKMTEVPMAHAGVVISFVGEPGDDVTGSDFQHGNLVETGKKGVWAEPLDPGKYPINPLTHKVESVPTSNIVLNWANDKSEAHKLDAHLSTITVRSADGFPYNLDVSQIIHIPRTDAPKVIARFGSVANLVTQVLEPTIGNYFRNAAQDSGVMDFLSHREQKQQDAKRKIAEALREYNVVAVDTLIGDINPPKDLMKTLTDRKIAEQEKVTYETQRLAEETRKELQQATALANTQARVVDAERTVQIADFTAQAAVKTAEGMARSKTINAEADAKVTQVNGDAEAGKIKAVGTAEADVIKLKIESMESGNYAAIEVARHLSTSGFKLVPEIVAGGGNGADGSSLVNVLLGNLVHDQMTAKTNHKVPETPTNIVVHTPVSS